MIDTVGNVARNAFVAFAGFTCLFARDISVHDKKPYFVPDSERQILSIEITVYGGCPLFTNRTASVFGKSFSGKEKTCFAG